MLKDVTFGQYYPAESFVHKMDSRMKILLTILFIVTIFFIDTFFAFGVLFVALATFLLISKIKIRSILKSIKGILFLIIFTVILTLFFNQGGNVLLDWGFIKITDSSLISSGLLALRLIFLILGASLLTLTTTPVALTDGIESLLAPLKLIRFPVHELALIMSITLRFIPTLAEETDRIMSAQKARGADFESGNLISRAKALIPILIPLLISAFRRAEELAFAMEARCYNGSKGRTKMKKLHFGWRDFVGMLFVVMFFVAILVIKFVFFGIFM